MSRRTRGKTLSHCSHSRPHGDYQCQRAEYNETKQLSLAQVRKLAREGMEQDDSIKDHGKAVQAMLSVLDTIESMPSPEEVAKADLREMAGNLQKDGSSSGIVVEDTFVDIDGFRLSRKQWELMR